MEIIKNMGESLKKLKENKNKTASLVLILGIFGMALILISEIIPSQNKAVITQKEIGFEENQNFEKELEERLSAIISKIEGTGKTEVMVTLDSSKEYFYAENYSEDRDETERAKENEIVIIDGENGEAPVIIKTSEAKVRGVLVICEGGGNALIKEKIITALCALLDIPSTRVSVAEMA